MDAFGAVAFDEGVDAAFLREADGLLDAAGLAGHEEDGRRAQSTPFRTLAVPVEAGAEVVEARLQQLGFGDHRRLEVIEAIQGEDQALGQIGLAAGIEEEALDAEGLHEDRDAGRGVAGRDELRPEAEAGGLGADFVTPEPAARAHVHPREAGESRNRESRKQKSVARMAGSHFCFLLSAFCFPERHRIRLGGLARLTQAEAAAIIQDGRGDGLRGAGIRDRDAVAVEGGQRVAAGVLEGGIPGADDFLQGYGADVELRDTDAEAGLGDALGVLSDVAASVAVQLGAALRAGDVVAGEAVVALLGGDDWIVGLLD